MAACLRRIRLRELSFVDKGASGDEQNRPRIALWKRRSEQNPSRKEKVVKNITPEIIKKVFAAIQLKKDGLPEGAQAVLDGIKSKLDESEWALIEMMLAGAAPMPVAESAKPVAPEAPAAGDGAAAPVDDPAMKKSKKEETAVTMKPEDVLKALAEKLSPAEPSALAKLAKTAPEAAAVLVEMQKRLDAAEAKAKESDEKFEKAEKENAANIQKARIARFEKIAETELKYLQGTPAEIAKRLADLEDVLGEDEFKKHLQMLKAASEQIAKSKTLQPVGASGADVEGSAHAAIVAKARELMKTDAKLTEPRAIAKIMQDRANVELVKRYRSEKTAH